MRGKRTILLEYILQLIALLVLKDLGRADTVDTEVTPHLSRKCVIYTKTESSLDYIARK